MQLHFRTRHTMLIVVMMCFTLVLASCKKSIPTDLATESIIPKPVSLTATNKSFEVTEKMSVYAAGGGQEFIDIGNYLAAELNKTTGFKTLAEAAPADAKDGSIYLEVVSDPELGDEGYELEITEERVSIRANKPAGVFFGVQTLLQIVPLPSNEKNNGWFLATGTIRDYPTYAWRGSMLDVARHFFSVEDVKRYIDLISYYKLNVLHLHLSDDQGWRIEIKSWPNLATTGGSTEVGGGKGGFYTQEDYKDIVAYAASKYITVIPEIDLPGHINSALASYGELNGGTIVPVEGRKKSQAATSGILDGKSKPTDLYTGIEVGWSTLRIEKEVTFKFVDDVLRELAAITPGPYLHIGGDEAHVTKKEDYIAFIGRFQEMVKAHGKKMVGWEEIAQGAIDSTSVVQHWNSTKYPIEGAEKGAKILMSPSTRVYLDMQYDSTTRIGLHWAAYIEVDAAYNWDPATQVEGVDKQQIVGVEAPLWSETVLNMNDIEFLVFPRLPGIAEVAWSKAEGRSWEEYKVRLGNHGPRMKFLGIDYYPSKKVTWK